jgi:hypothetical protein
MGALLTPRKLALDNGEPKARTDYEDRFERSLLAGYGKKYCGVQETQWPKGYRQQMNTPQDAQKGRPARPQRAKKRGVRFGTLSL